MDDRIKLHVLGISYSPLQSGAFALLLAQDDGPYRIPIVIGAAEAQSIAIRMEGVVTPRPITHDLFCSFAHAFSISLEEVFIYKFEDGIFSSELTFSDGRREVKLDSRTSDAIAIALRTGAPIYTTREILMETGAIFKRETVIDDDGTIEAVFDNTSLDDMSDDDLQLTLDKLISEENYEEAARISEIIKKRKDKDEEQEC